MVLICVFSNVDLIFLEMFVCIVVYDSLNFVSDVKVSMNLSGVVVL